MPDLRRRNCQGCGKPREEVGNISWSGLCESCANERVAANIIGLTSRSGAAYDHWVRRSFMAARRALVASEQDAA